MLCTVNEGGGKGGGYYPPFVAYEHDDHVAVAVLPGVLQPGGQMVEGVPPRDIVDQQSASRATVVGTGD